MVRPVMVRVQQDQAIKAGSGHQGGTRLPTTIARGLTGLGSKSKLQGGDRASHRQA